MLYSTFRNYGQNKSNLGNGKIVQKTFFENVCHSPRFPLNIFIIFYYWFILQMIKLIDLFQIPYFSKEKPYLEKYCTICSKFSEVPGYWNNYPHDCPKARHSGHYSMSRLKEWRMIYTCKFNCAIDGHYRPCIYYREAQNDRLSSLDFKIPDKYSLKHSFPSLEVEERNFKYIYDGKYITDSQRNFVLDKKLGNIFSLGKNGIIYKYS